MWVVPKDPLDLRQTQKLLFINGRFDDVKYINFLYKNDVTVFYQYETSLTL
jgi:hypothetical protein